MQGALRGPLSGGLIQQLERLFDQGTAVGLGEAELLERFLLAGDEVAFEALIARFGPMVLGVCRQLLRDPNDVDDAFQATFLVLVRKAGSLRRRDLLGNWLYGVAHRVAARSRAVSARRTALAPYGHDAVERLVAGEGQPSGGEPIPWMHEEVRRLPEKYRSMVLLCYFEGLTHEQAAVRLGCPIGTVKGRLARAREILRKRLVRRGVAISSAAIGSQLAEASLGAAVPESLVLATLRAAHAAAVCNASWLVAGAGVSLPVASLTDGALHAMVITHFKAVVIPLLIAGVVTTGVVIGAAAQQSGSGGSAAASSGASQSNQVSTKAVPTPLTRFDFDVQEARRRLAVTDLLQGSQQLYDELVEDGRLLNSRDLPKLRRLSERILMASCELGTVHGSRVAEYSAHRDRMKGLAELMKKLGEDDTQKRPDDTTARDDAELAASFLAEAEKLLDKEKKKEPASQGASGMAGMMAGMAPAAPKGQPAAPSGSAMMVGGRAQATTKSQAAASSGESSTSTAKPSTGTPGKTATTTAKTNTVGGGAITGRGGKGGGGMGGMGGMGYDSSYAQARERVEIAQLASVLAANGSDPKNEGAFKRLDQLSEISIATPTPLKDILNEIRSSLRGSQGNTTVPVFVDPKGLEQARVTLDTPVSLDLRGIPFKSALRLLLKQLGLAYCVRDGVLIISSVDGIREELAEAAGELRGKEPSNMDSIIQSTSSGMMGGGLR